MPRAFSKAKVMSFPRHVLVGHGVLDDLAGLSDDLGLAGGRVLVVTGPHTRALAGDRAVEILRKNGYEVRETSVDGATMRNVQAAEQAAREIGAVGVFGVGGGSVIDVAKLAAYRLDVPFVSVPTAASHDGITSPRASIREADSGPSGSQEASAPMAIVADTAVIVKAPYRMLAAGCADALSNGTAVLDWKLAHRLKGEEYSSFAAVLAQTASDLIMENARNIKPGIEDSAWVVVKSLIVSGVSMSVAGSSRPASGAEHMISHTLDQLAPDAAYHGEQVGVASILTMYLHGGDWEQIRAALSSVGAPTTAKALGIPRDVFVQALTIAHRNKPDRYTILGDNGLTRSAADELLRVTGVAP